MPVNLNRTAIGSVVANDTAQWLPPGASVSATLAASVPLVIAQPAGLSSAAFRLITNVSGFSFAPISIRDALAKFSASLPPDGVLWRRSSLAFASPPRTVDGISMQLSRGVNVACPACTGFVAQTGAALSSMSLT